MVARRGRGGLLLFQSSLSFLYCLRAYLLTLCRVLPTDSICSSCTVTVIPLPNMQYVPAVSTLLNDCLHYSINSMQTYIVGSVSFIV